MMASKTTESKYNSLQGTLRKVAIGAAACGLLFNIISLSIAAKAHRERQRGVIIVDACAFFPVSNAR